MVSNYYSGYEQERKRRRAEWEQAPKECPHCHTPINQRFLEYGSDKPRHHCGADKCRQAVSRANIAKRKQQERDEARARVLAYCDDHLDRDQRHAVMSMCDMLMRYSHEEGHQVALQVIGVLEDLRCKHDRIQVLVDNAAAFKRRAEKAEEYTQELEQVKNMRIEELEAELHVFQLVENAIHNIAQRQLEKQPEPQKQQPAPEPEDEDRRAVLATLARAGIKP